MDHVSYSEENMRMCSGGDKSVPHLHVAPGNISGLPALRRISIASPEIFISAWWGDRAVRFKPMMMNWLDLLFTSTLIRSLTDLTICYSELTDRVCESLIREGRLQKLRLRPSPEYSYIIWSRYREATNGATPSTPQQNVATGSACGVGILQLLALPSLRELELALPVNDDLENHLRMISTIHRNTNLVSLVFRGREFVALHEYCWNYISHTSAAELCQSSLQSIVVDTDDWHLSAAIVNLLREPTIRLEELTLCQADREGALGIISVHRNTLHRLSLRTLHMDRNIQGRLDEALGGLLCLESLSIAFRPSYTRVNDDNNNSEAGIVACPELADILQSQLQKLSMLCNLEVTLNYDHPMLMRHMSGLLLLLAKDGLDKLLPNLHSIRLQQRVAEHSYFSHYRSMCVSQSDLFRYTRTSTPAPYHACSGKGYCDKCRELEDRDGNLEALALSICTASKSRPSLAIAVRLHIFSSCSERVTAFFNTINCAQLPDHVQVEIIHRPLGTCHLRLR